MDRIGQPYKLTVVCCRGRQEVSYGAFVDQQIVALNELKLNVF